MINDVLLALLVTIAFSAESIMRRRLMLVEDTLQVQASVFLLRAMPPVALFLFLEYVAASLLDNVLPSAQALLLAVAVSILLTLVTVKYDSAAWEPESSQAVDVLELIDGRLRELNEQQAKEVVSMKERLAALEETARSIPVRLGELRDSVKALDGDVEKLLVKADALTNELYHIKETVYEIDGLAPATLGELNRSEASRSELKEQLHRANEKLFELTTSVRELSTKIENQQHPPAAPSPPSSSSQTTAVAKPISLGERFGELVKSATDSLSKPHGSRSYEFTMWGRLAPSEISPREVEALRRVRAMALAGRRVYVSSLSSELGWSKGQVADTVDPLTKKGFLTSRRVSGEEWVKPWPAPITYDLADRARRLFEQSVTGQSAGGDEHHYLMRAAREKYLIEGGMFFQELPQHKGLIRPDGYFLRELDSREWDNSSATAVECETPSEVRAHPDQVFWNMAKSFVLDFSSVAVWVFEEDKERVGRIIEQLPPVLAARVTLECIIASGKEPKRPTQ
ncbi:MAG: hypothetical protein JRM82_03260 [Nitrososphaerota archaeon]|nr:hypothetical protein [Nitrososphaerota archaeon]